jgi:hypothetical protein
VFKFYSELSYTLGTTALYEEGITYIGHMILIKYLASPLKVCGSNLGQNNSFSKV